MLIDRVFILAHPAADGRSLKVRSKFIGRLEVFSMGSTKICFTEGAEACSLFYFL